jgi:hypothetical protein
MPSNFVLTLAVSAFPDVLDRTRADGLRIAYIVTDDERRFQALARRRLSFGICVISKHVRSPRGLTATAPK